VILCNVTDLCIVVLIVQSTKVYAVSIFFFSTVTTICDFYQFFTNIKITVNPFLLLCLIDVAFNNVCKLIHNMTVCALIVSALRSTH